MYGIVAVVTVEELELSLFPVHMLRFTRSVFLLSFLT